MGAKVPHDPHVQDENHRPDDRSFAAFKKKKIEPAMQATKQESKHQRDKNKGRIGLKHGWCEQLKRAQCYLGVRLRAEPGMPDTVQGDNIPTASAQGR